MEQILAQQQLDVIADERAKELLAEAEAKNHTERAHEFGMAYEPKRTVKVDDDAKRIADEPLLTGDPEWDAIELRETNRAPLKERKVFRG